MGLWAPPSATGKLAGPKRDKDHTPRTDVGGGSKASEALATRMSLGSLGNLRVKEEPERTLAQIWETQWQEFLKTVECPQSGPEAPHLPEELPPWDDAKAFLASFEQVAEACRWPKEEWVARLLPALSGVAAQAFSRLEARDREDYEKVKATILQGDAMSREKSRQHFRHFCYQEAEGPRGAYGRLEELCHRWLKAKSHSKEQILELLILEQFMAVLPPEIQSWVKENNPENSGHAVLLAEDFFLKQRVSGTQQQQLAEPPAEAAVNSQAAERAPSDAGQKLQLCRETKEEGDLGSSDHRHVNVMKEPQPQENSQRAEPQGQRESNNGPQYSDDGETSGTLHMPKKQQEIRLAEGEHETIPCEGVSMKPNITRLHRGIQKSRRRNICFVCGKNFSRNARLILHKRTHTGERPYTCSQCRKSFICSEYLRRHQNTHTGEKPHKCLDCGKGFVCKRYLNRHRRIHTGETPYKCPDCGKSFMWRTSLSVHRRSHAGEKAAVLLPEETIYICCECGESFNRTVDLDIHQRSHVGEKPYAHTVSGERYHYKRHLGRHKSIHTGEKPFKCPDCGENFMWHSSFERHRKIHTGEKPALLVCKRTCTGAKKYVCSVCEKGFFKLWQLRRHQHVHTGTKPYKCIDCGESFMWSSSLERHRKNHAKERLAPLLQKRPCVEEKSHICSKCGKSFKRASHLIRHQRIHTGERPYKCSNCGESFMWSSSLDRHRKLHRGKKTPPLLQRMPPIERKSHICSVCGKSFKRPSHLKRHQNIHTGEKPYKCSECRRSFVHKDSLTRHKRTHTGL